MAPPVLLLSSLFSACPRPKRGVGKTHASSQRMNDAPQFNHTAGESLLLPDFDEAF